MKSYLIFLLVFTAAMTAAAQGNDNSQGSVAPELVGKWCYIPSSAHTLESLSTSCITLNADGTYDLQIDPGLVGSFGATLPGGQTNDSGIWSFGNGVIYYKSSSQGKGSLRVQKINHPRIENTPTLVINGAIFCPATPRDPW